MAGLLWFVPDCKDVPIGDVIARAGLGELLCEGDDQPGITDGIVAGPCGLKGRMLTYLPRGATAERPIAFKDAGQTWKKASKRGDLPAGRYWVGMWNAPEARPTPAELRRNVMLLGVPVALAGGSTTWDVPLAVQLPQTMGLDDEGRVTTFYEQQRHQAYFDRAWELVHKARESAIEGVIRYDFDEHFRFAVEALSLNYRVNADALTLLKAVRSDLVFGAAHAAAGFPSLDSETKKQEPEPSTVPGGSGSGEAAAEPSAS